MTPGLSPRVHAFAVEHLDSIEMLEVLLLLAQQPGTMLTADHISERLRTSPSSARSRLEALHRQDLIERTAGDGFLFARTSPHRALIDELAAAYREKRVTMVSVIHSRPSEVVTVFADASALRRGARAKKRGGDL